MILLFENGLIVFNLGKVGCPVCTYGKSRVSHLHLFYFFAWKGNKICCAFYFASFHKCFPNDYSITLPPYLVFLLHIYRIFISCLYHP